MKFPNWLKYLIWGVLLAAIGTFVGFRFKAFMSGGVSAIDVVVFIVGVALLLIPLFQEVEVLGVKLKREIETLKTEVKDQMVSLRTEVLNSINVANQFAPNIYLNQPASDQQLENIAQKVQEIVDARVEPQEKTQVVYQKPETEIPITTQYLFNVRYNIEKEIRRILEELHYDSTFFPLKGALRRIREKLNVNWEFIKALENIVAIANMAVHGEDVTEEQHKFVQSVYPDLLAFLKKLPE